MQSSSASGGTRNPNHNLTPKHQTNQQPQRRQPFKETQNDNDSGTGTIARPFATIARTLRWRPQNKIAVPSARALVPKWPVSRTDLSIHGRVRTTLHANPPEGSPIAPEPQPDRAHGCVWTAVLGACKQSKDPEGANQGRSVIRTVQRGPLTVRNAPRYASGESAFGREPVEP